MPSRLIVSALILCLGLGPGIRALAADEPTGPRTRLGQRMAQWLRRDAPPDVAPPVDPMTRPAQAEGLPRALPPAPEQPILMRAPSLPVAGPSALAAEAVPSAMGGQSLSLQAALNGVLTGNPDLVTLRQGLPANAPSPEAVEVARRFPTTLNPTLWIDYRPFTQIPNGPQGKFPPGPDGPRDYYRSGNQFLNLSIRQPLELGHQTTHRYRIALAALDQQRWTVMQAELTALVQTYRLFQTAAYRREKLAVAKNLADFNDRLLQSLEQRLEANQVIPADVVLARVESRATRQQVMAARQDYLTALADLRNQVGITEEAGATEPLGEFTLPPYLPRVDEDAMVQTALANRPDVLAAVAQVRGSDAAVRLARADRIPTPVVGPEYQANQDGGQFVGFIYITTLPVVNNGAPLVRQREAEARRAAVALQQARQRVVAQVRAAVVKWNGATELVSETSGLTVELAGEVAKLERLFDEGLSDLTVLLQGRQRLLQLENSRLDAVWAATQAQADLLLALGTPALINAMLARAESDDVASTPPPRDGTAPREAADRTPGTR